jgi:hypothetical protein
MIKYLYFFFNFFQSLTNNKNLAPEPDPDPGGKLITDPPDPDPQPGQPQKKACILPEVGWMLRELRSSWAATELGWSASKERLRLRIPEPGFTCNL